MSANQIGVTEGAGKNVGTETVGSIDYGLVEIVSKGGSSVLSIAPDGSLKASIIGVPTVTFSGAPSISGTVSIGNAPSIYGNISGSVAAFLQGNASLITIVQGSVAQAQIGTQITSVSGTVNVSGSVVGFMGGSWSASIAGGFVNLYAPSASFVSGVTSIITTTNQTSVLATAPGAQRNYVTQMLVTNAGVVATQVNIMDGPTVIYAGYAAASGGGFALSFPTPLKQATLAQSLDVKAVTTTSISAAISGFTAA